VKAVWPRSGEAHSPTKTLAATPVPGTSFVASRLGPDILLAYVTVTRRAREVAQDSAPVSHQSAAADMTEQSLTMEPEPRLRSGLVIPYENGPMSVEAIARIAAPHGIPILVDAAPEILTIPNVHLQRGATLVAYAVARGERPSLLALKRVCAARLPRYMIVDTVHYLPVLPRTGNGKVHRAALAPATQPQERIQ
jgi:acyl-CoA synthetase (AMP-forming)/AMP-acid ligase II